MREQLIGYLFDALDDVERRDVEIALADPREGEGLRRDLGLLKRATAPLGRDRELMPVPAGLAARTIAFVQARAAAEVEAAPSPRPMTPVQDAAVSGRARLDRVLVVASALAASILVLPLVYDAIASSRMRRVERNLQTVASAMHGYGDNHRILPTPPDSGPLSRAGLYAPTLVSAHRLLADDGTILVPDSQLARDGKFRVPTREELEAAVGTSRFDDLVRRMGGDFGYTLGYRCSKGSLEPIRDLRRATHPMLADTPAPCCEKSDNHPDGTHYILFEDGHFERRRLEAIHEVGDHLYRNHAGAVAAGVNRDDAVIGSSHSQR